MRGGAAVLALAAAFLVAGCGTGGIARGGDQSRGKQLFAEKCGGCHTLADSGSNGKVGPNLDDAFASGRKQGFKESTIEQVVVDQIKLATGQMPPNLVRGKDAESVAAYVFPEYTEWLRANLPAERDAGLRPKHKAFVEKQIEAVRKMVANDESQRA